MSFLVYVIEEPTYENILSSACNIFLKESVKFDASLIFSKYSGLKSQLQDVAKTNKITMQVLLITSGS